MLDILRMLDTRTLIIVLCLGNLVSAILTITYFILSTGKSIIAKYYGPAKLCQAAAFLLLGFRGILSDELSVHLGNSLMFVGFYLESLCMFTINNIDGWAKKAVTIITVLSLVIFNLVEFFYHSDELRVGVSSICVFAVLVIPILQLLIPCKSTWFKRAVGLYYLCFIVILIPRTYNAFTSHLSLLSNTAVQSLTFLSLVLLLTYSLAAYFLIMKEDADELIRQLATTDFLTGLSNRYSFIQSAQRIFLRHKMAGKSIAVLYMDIDYFKRANDSYGHAFGDEVLKSIGAMLGKHVRPMDLICRYGGEEFLALLQDADIATAGMVAERLRLQTQQLHFPQHPDYHLTISIGLSAGVPGEDEELEQFINRADAALYRAKDSGRNMVMS